MRPPAAASSICARRYRRYDPRRFRERRGPMGRLVEVVAAVAAILVYFVAEEARDETTLYPVRCVGSGCERLEPLRRTIYHVVPGGNYVVYWSPDSPDSAPARLG